MTMVKISYLEITARTSFPTIGCGEKDAFPLHLWEPTLQTMGVQTLKDFELIFIDVLYEDRPDYFKDHNYGLRIKHIPANPNAWHEKGLVQTCSQFNKGIIHADGELLFTSADSNMYPPNLMENLWRHYKDGYFTSLGFGSDLTYSPELYERTLQADGTYKDNVGSWQGAQSLDNSVPTDWYNYLPFKGKVIMDHRYRSLFNNPQENHTHRMNYAEIPPNWYYGISTMSLDAALKVNGYDQSLDGDSALNDVDMGNRLAILGYTLAMFRDSYCVEAYAGTFWNPKMKSPRPEVKCNYGIVQYNKYRRRTRVNDAFPSPPLIEAEIIQDICRTRCDLWEKCSTMPHRGPFYNRNEPELYDYWKNKASQVRINLQYEREDRLDNSAYTEGSFYNV